MSVRHDPADNPAVPVRPEPEVRRHHILTDAARPAEPDRRRKTDAVKLAESWLDALFPEPTVGNPDAARQADRAGVIASFILNASMIPGWPPPRPFEAPSMEGLLTGLAQKPGGVGKLMSGLLPEDRRQPALLRLLRRRLARFARSRRLRMILGLTALLTAIAVFEAELVRLAGELHADTDPADRPA